MSFWTFLGSSAGAAAGEAVGKTLGSVGTLAKDIRTALTGVTPEAKSQVEVLLAQLDAAVQQGQQELNRLDAGGSFFHSGWRPAVGWTCVFALNWHYILKDTLAWLLATSLPKLDVMDLIALLSAMLGLGAYRTFEKTRGAPQAPRQ